ncbi:hypothetical protein NERG_01886 [Nematocida ausubeli]|uniref:Uncharacterized protein n=1 Tax=Nematocida ausubeli (strain ATCC PRA-371 / ERTm2) TaxID=1913371 RepID=H8ZE65_NEMA1|nr:hypothetical protein NERG_01886 [Nematocida ausubeli]
MPRENNLNCAKYLTCKKYILAQKHKTKVLSSSRQAKCASSKSKCKTGVPQEWSYMTRRTLLVIMVLVCFAEMELFAVASGASSKNLQNKEKKKRSIKNTIISFLNHDKKNSVDSAGSDKQKAQKEKEEKNSGEEKNIRIHLKDVSEDQNPSISQNNLPQTLNILNTEEPPKDEGYMEEKFSLMEYLVSSNGGKNLNSEEPPKDAEALKDLSSEEPPKDEGYMEEKFSLMEYLMSSNGVKNLNSEETHMHEKNLEDLAKLSELLKNLKDFEDLSIEEPPKDEETLKDLSSEESSKNEETLKDLSSEEPPKDEEALKYVHNAESLNYAESLEFINPEEEFSNMETCINEIISRAYGVPVYAETAAVSEKIYDHTYIPSVSSLKENVKKAHKVCINIKNNLVAEGKKKEYYAKYKEFEKERDIYLRMAKDLNSYLESRFKVKECVASINAYCLSNSISMEPGVCKEYDNAKKEVDAISLEIKELVNPTKKDIEDEFKILCSVVNKLKEHENIPETEYKDVLNEVLEANAKFNDIFLNEENIFEKLDRKNELLYSMRFKEEKYLDSMKQDTNQISNAIKSHINYLSVSKKANIFRKAILDHQCTSIENTKMEIRAYNSYKNAEKQHKDMKDALKEAEYKLMEAKNALDQYYVKHPIAAMESDI